MAVVEAHLKLPVPVMYVFPVGGTDGDKVRWGEHLQRWACNTWNGGLDTLVAANNDHVIIPIDPYTAYHLGWINAQEFLASFPSLPEDIVAAIRLVTTHD